jgi:hypothetical protein
MINWKLTPKAELIVACGKRGTPYSDRIEGPDALKLPTRRAEYSLT